MSILRGKTVRIERDKKIYDNYWAVLTVEVTDENHPLLKTALKKMNLTIDEVVLNIVGGNTYIYALGYNSRTLRRSKKSNDRPG